MKLFIICLFVFFVGCLKTPWDSASENYRCNKEQFEKMKYEAEWCMDHATYSNRYCFCASIIRNCTPIK
jgi:hypothetical protein